MITLVRFIGIIMIVLGAVFSLNPKAMRLHIDFWIKGQRIYAGGILSLLFSVIFFIAASQCLLPWFLATLGILSLIKGIVLLAAGPERLKPRLDWWQGRSDTFLRLYSILPLVIGILLIYSA